MLLQQIFLGYVTVLIVILGDAPEVVICTTVSKPDCTSLLGYLGDRSDTQAISSTAASHKDMASVTHHMQAAAHIVGCTGLMPRGKRDITALCLKRHGLHET